MESQTLDPLYKYVSEFCHLKSRNLGCRIINFEVIGKQEKLEGAVVMHSSQESSELLNIIQIQMTIVHIVEHHPSGKYWIPPQLSEVGLNDNLYILSVLLHFDI